MGLPEVFIGIDPGAKGAIALIDKSNRVLELLDFEEAIKSMIDIYRNYDIKMCALEKVGSMPKQGVTSMFNFGVNYGRWIQAIAMLGIPVVDVRPQEWQKGMGLPADKKARKDAIFSKAEAMFPGAPMYGPQGGKKDGRSDALMIAAWCKRNYG